MPWNATEPPPRRRPLTLRRSLLWRLLPALGLLLVAGLWFSRQDTLEAANAAYDRSLLGALKAIDANIGTASGGLSVELPYRLFEFFELTASGTVHFRVATSDGLVELGSADLPPPPRALRLDTPLFYDATYFDEPIRVAAYERTLDQAVAHSSARRVTIQVAESTRSREDFSAGLVRRALAREGLMLALTLLATLGLAGLALRPLSRLAAEVRARRTDDLTPLPSAHLPADLRPLVQAVNQQMARTQALVGQQRQFLDDASHQLRTHLTTLQMQVGYAQLEPAGPEVREALHALQAELLRATHSTHQLLSLARSDTVALQPEAFDLGELLREVAVHSLARARQRQIDLGVAAPEGPDERQQATGDRGLLREALLNLCTNAIDHTPPGTEVTLTAAGDALGWQLGVDDNGPGLSEDQCRLAGQRFARGPSGSSSGLGLAIARAIVERHGGSLRLDTPADHPGLSARLWWPRPGTPAPGAVP